MATEADAQSVESITGYIFRKDPGLLRRALTAAGAVIEDWDGNRKLAQLGTSLSEFVFNYLAYEGQATRENTNGFRCSLSSNTHRAAVARCTGIDRHIKYCEQEGAKSSTVLGKAIGAILGAIFIDCGSDISVVLGVMQHLGIFNRPGQPINPTLLTAHQNERSPDVTSLAEALFGVSNVGHSPPILSNLNQDIEVLPLTSSSRSSVPLSTAVVSDGSELAGNDDQPALPLASSGHPTRNPSLGTLSTNQFCWDAGLGSDGQKSLGHDTVAIAQDRPRPVSKRTSPPPCEPVRKKMQRKGSNLDNDGVLQKHLSEETRKCELVGHRPPQETFLTPVIQQATLDLNGDKAGALSKILVYIASPHLLARLQEMLEKSRNQQDHSALLAPGPLSQADRYYLIDRLGRTISHYQLLRRYHILKLFKECGGATIHQSGMVLIAPCSFEDAPSRPGNPLNMSLANVTTKMMEEIFPDVEKGTEDYKVKYRTMSCLRKLGERLDAIQERFGEGTLGLILDNGAIGSVDVGISDNMIMCLGDPEYRKFVDLLDKSQGNMLRKFSAAITPVVEALTSGNVQQRSPLNLETIPKCDILRYPKGSSELLDIISGTGLRSTT